MNEPTPETMQTEHFEVALNDELQWSYIPKSSTDEEDAAAREKDLLIFLAKWTEKGGIPPSGPVDVEEEEDEDDDIGANFVTTDRQLANANHDIGRLLSNARIVVSKLPHPPDMATGHKMVLLDRARRVAFGEAKPAPMSLTKGMDGGVDRTLFRRRRPRPEDFEHDGKQVEAASKGGGRRADMLPRRRADTGTACVGVQPNQFDVGGGRRPTRPGPRVAKHMYDVMGTMPLRRNRTHNLQRVLARHLLRKPAVTAVQAALRRL